MLQWVIGFSEFADITEFLMYLGKTLLFLEIQLNLLAFHLTKKVAILQKFRKLSLSSIKVIRKKSMNEKKKHFIITTVFYCLWVSNRNNLEQKHLFFHQLNITLFPSTTTVDRWNLMMFLLFRTFGKKNITCGKNHWRSELRYTARKSK